MKLKNYLKNKASNQATALKKEAVALKLGEKYAPKSTLESLGGLAMLCEILVAMLGTGSALLGTKGLGDLLAELGQVEGLVSYSLYFIAALFLFGLEATKAKALQTSFTWQLLKNRTHILALVAGIALATLSGTASVLSLMAFQEEKGKGKVEQLESKQAVKLSELESMRQSVIKRNTWKGKTYLPKAERQLVQTLEADILALKKDQKAEKGSTEQKHEEETDHLITVVLGLETLILLLWAFITWFEIRVLKESYLQPEHITHTAPSTTQNTNTMGFKPEKSKELENTGEPKLKGLPAGLVAALEDDPTLPTVKLTQAFAVNVPQVSKARKLAELIRNWDA